MYKNLIDLINSENLYKNIFQFSPYPIIIIDSNANILGFNDFTWEFLGYDSKNEALKDLKNILEIVDIDFKERLINNIKSLIKENSYQAEQYKIFDRKGNIHFVEINLKIFNDFNSSKAQLIFCTFIDKTDFVSVSKTLFVSESRYKLLFQNANDAILIMDKEIFIDCNQKALELFGCEKDQIIGKAPYLFSPFYQEDGRISKEKALEKINEALNGRKQFFEWKHIRLDGTSFDAEVSLNAQRIEDKIYILAIVRDITQRKSIEKQLRGEHRILKTIIESIPDPTFVIDKTGTVIYWNKAIEELTDVKKEDIIGKSNYQYALPFYGIRRPILIDLALNTSLIDNFVQNYKYINNEGDVLTAETSIEKYQKKRIYLWSKATPLYDQDNNIIGAIESIRDITKIKEKEIALNESESKFKEIFNSTTDSIQIDEISEDGGKIIDCNLTTLSMYGYDSKEEFLKCKRGDLSSNIYPYTDDIAQGWIKKAIDGQIVTFEWLAKKKNNETFWVEVTLKKVSLSGKDRILAVVRDIDKRKNDEKRLEESEGRFKATFNSIVDAVISVDNKGNILLSNPGITKITGYLFDEMQNKKLSDFIRIVDEQDNNKIIDPISNILQREINKESGYNKLLITKDNDTKNISYSASAILDRENRILGCVLVIHDITENIRLFNQVQNMKRLESLSLLAAAIAHDINNILEGVYGNIELATKSNDKTESLNYLSNAINSFDRAKRITNQLLTFAKGGEPKKKSVSIKNLLKDVVEFSSSGSNIKTEYFIDEDLWNCEVDLTQISQVIQNITINAIQAMNLHGILKVKAMNITLDKVNGSLLSGKYVKIEIIDNGKGIPKEILPRIFDPFFTTKEKGNGLGLSICHSIITQHNGIIEVESKENEGATFSIYLPASNNLELKFNMEKEKKLKEKDLKGKKVLILDDDLTILKVIQKMLEKLDCEVILADEGQKAIDIFINNKKENKPFDLLLFDLTIKDGVNGIDALKEIRKIDKDVIAIASSGYSDDNAISNPCDFGFNDSLAKPFNFDQIKDLLLKYF